MSDCSEDNNISLDIPFVVVGDEDMLRPNEVAEVAIEGDSILICNSEIIPCFWK